MQPKPITFEQSFREADAFAVWPKLAKIVNPLTKALKATKRGRETARRSLVDAEGRPPVNNKLRAKLRQIPVKDLARVVVHAVLGAMIGWLKEDEDGELEENPFNAAVLQDVARAIGRHVLQAYMRIDRPNLTPQR